jgi:Family of unknown function (DUF5995)
MSGMPASLPTTVDGVIDRLRTIQHSLPAGDGVAVFNRMYLDVTERVAAAIDADDFADAGFMVELDVRFANLWLGAYDAVALGRVAPSAWKPLFEERDTAGLLPIQHALAGMNAHIEHDLPLAVVETCRARRTNPGAPGVREDYERVNDVLAVVESEIRRSFLTAIGRRLDEEIGPLVHLVSAWNIDKARDLAWVTVETLWTMRELELLSSRYVRMLGHTVGMGSRILLTPVARSLAPAG